LATWALLAYVGLDHALFLGALAGILHIIPYVGSLIAALIVGLVALVKFNDLYQATYLVLGVIAIAALIGVVLTAWVQSRAARINSVVLIAWVLFLGWLWEGWGLILAVPMLAVIKAISDGIVQLRPLSEFLGD
jgi:predicted PurR-regulated permease PerM